MPARLASSIVHCDAVDVAGVAAFAADDDTGVGRLVDPHFVSRAESQGTTQFGLRCGTSFDDVDLRQGHHRADAEFGAEQDAGGDCFGAVPHFGGDELGFGDLFGELGGWAHQVDPVVAADWLNSMRGEASR